MRTRQTLLGTALLSLVVLVLVPLRGYAQRFAPPAGPVPAAPGGYTPPFVGVYMPAPNGTPGGYDPAVASVPSAAYFNYGGRTAYTTESPLPATAPPPPPSAFAPPPPPLQLTALLQVQVAGEAEVWLEGQKMRSTGPIRRFRSPPLNPAKDYLYEVRVRWPNENKPLEEVQMVSIRAGASVVVDFAPPPSPSLPRPRPVGDGFTPTRTNSR
jgi:uncharacterized protein (TIGR03000 family)